MDGGGDTPSALPAWFVAENPVRNESGRPSIAEVARASARGRGVGEPSGADRRRARARLLRTSPREPASNASSSTCSATPARLERRSPAGPRAPRNRAAERPWARRRVTLTAAVCLTDRRRREPRPGVERRRGRKRSRPQPSTAMRAPGHADCSGVDVDAYNLMDSTTMGRRAPTPWTRAPRRGQNYRRGRHRRGERPHLPGHRRLGEDTERVEIAADLREKASRG
jgi:hypothetical protein